MQREKDTSAVWGRRTLYTECREEYHLMSNELQEQASNLKSVWRHYTTAVFIVFGGALTVTQKSWGLGEDHLWTGTWIWCVELYSLRSCCPRTQNWGWLEGNCLYWQCYKMFLTQTLRFYPRLHQIIDPSQYNGCWNLGNNPETY